MAHFDRYQPTRYVRPGREAIVPFAVGLLLIIAGAAIGFVAAAMTGSFAAQPAAAAAASTPAVSIAAATETTRVCRAPEAVADGLDGRHEPAFTFGFLVFDWDATEGGGTPGFAPLPATVCRLTRSSVDG